MTRRRRVPAETPARQSGSRVRLLNFEGSCRRLRLLLSEGPRPCPKAHRDRDFTPFLPPPEGSFGAPEKISFS